jgi:transposase-like protein
LESPIYSIKFLGVYYTSLDSGREDAGYFTLTDDSLFKMLYLAMKDITKKWTGHRQDWSSIYAQLVIYYGDRIPE